MEQQAHSEAAGERREQELNGKTNLDLWVDFCVLEVYFWGLFWGFFLTCFVASQLLFWQLVT